MEKKLELIWKKLDGDISGEEAKIFDALFKNNAEFKTLYLEQSRLNNTLRNIPLEKAPETLIDNVMNAVRSNSVLSSNISFSGIKTILLLFGSFIVISCVWYFSSNGINLSSTESSFVGSTLDSLLSKMVISDSLKSYLPYSLVLVAGLGLLWIDGFMKNSRFSYTQML